LPAHQVGEQFRHAIEFVLCVAVDDRNVLAFHIAGFREPLTKRAQPGVHSLGRSQVDNPDRRQRRLLCLRRARPSGCRAGQHSEEIAPSHRAVTRSQSRRDSI